MMVVFTRSPLLGVHEAFGLLVLFVFFLDDGLDHVVLLFVLWRQGGGPAVLYELFLGRHIEYLKQIVDVEVV